MAVDGRSDAVGGRRLRLGMVGGGQGAFIGAVHRLAARMDDQFEFVAGALASSAAKALASGRELGLAADRIYSDYKQMAAAEKARPDGIDAVSIVTPNHLHAPVAAAFMEAGIDVICDKPLCLTSKEARELIAVRDRSRVVFALTHHYSCYPMVRQARAMIAAGDLGEIRLVQGEYVQDWLTTPLETTGQKQADWRTDPARSGAGGCVGDIGTHTYHLGCFMSGLEADTLSADLATFVAGRKLDDNVHVMLRYRGGARGLLWSSQVAPGNENALMIRIYGSKAGLEWRQEDPNYLWFTPHGEPKRLLTRSGAGAGPAAARVTRVPPGHPEGYLDAFGTMYSEAARAIRARRSGQPLAADVEFPTLEDGLAGMRFIEACVASSAANGQWVVV